MSAPATYVALQAKVMDLLHRTGDTDVSALVTDWIAYAESEMQTKIKLLEFEMSSDVTITAGSGVLPSGYIGMRSVYWADDTNAVLAYINADGFDAMRNESQTPGFYTITGSTIKVSPSADGVLAMTCMARFTPLSDAVTSNAILTNSPDLYVYGTLKHANVWTEDDAAVQKFGTMFNAACERVNVNNEQRKYGSSLAVRAR